jgi:hypothetical protein
VSAGIAVKELKKLTTYNLQRDSPKYQERNIVSDTSPSGQHPFSKLR